MRIDFGSLDSSVSGTRGRRAVGKAATVPSLGTFFTEFRKVEEDVSIPLICSEVLTNERTLHVGESTKRGLWMGCFLNLSQEGSQEAGKCASIWTNCLMLSLSFHHRTTR